MNKAYVVNKALVLLKSKGVGNLKLTFCGSKNFSLQSEIAKIKVFGLLLYSARSALRYNLRNDSNDA